MFQRDYFLLHLAQFHAAGQATGPVKEINDSPWKTANQNNEKTQAALKEKATLHLTKSDKIDLAAMLRTLRSRYNVRRLACEGGPTLFRALLERGLIDQLNLTIAPYMFGGAKAPTLTGLTKAFLPASVHCSLINMRIIGDECFLTYRIKHQRRRN